MPLRAPLRRALHRLAGLGALLSCAACAPYLGYGLRHEVQWNSADQVWRAEDSQVRLRSAQSRVYDSRDRTAMVRAVVQTFQDLGFQVEVLDLDLGIVSGKKFLAMERPANEQLAAYLLAKEDDLIVFQRSYRSWGPFKRRSDLVRLTVTVRHRNEAQLVVRAASQFYLRPVEEPQAYQHFYAALEQALFAQRGRP